MHDFRDTALVLTTFRLVMRRVVLVAAVVTSAYVVAIVPSQHWVWKLLLAAVGTYVAAYRMMDVRRSFPVLLAGVAMFLIAAFAADTALAFAFGSDAGFHLLLLTSLPVVMVAGRIGTLTKWLLATAFFAYVFVVDRLAAEVVPTIVTAHELTSVLYGVNVATASFIVTAIIHHYFDIVTRQQAQLHAMATTDPLTGLFNRRHLLEVAERDLLDARRYRYPLSVVIGDLDHFKSVNDRLGHDGGDQVLRHASAIFKAGARVTDSVARWGGEEFLLVAPHTDLAGAEVLAQRICHDLALTPVSIGTHLEKATTTLGLPRCAMASRSTSWWRAPIWRSTKASARGATAYSANEPSMPAHPNRTSAPADNAWQWLVHRTLSMRHHAARCVIALAALASAATAAMATPEPLPAPGVPLTLAQSRAARISALRYQVALNMPAARHASITGQLRAEFNLADHDTALDVDFAASPRYLHAVRVNGAKIKAAVVQQHIRLPAASLRTGHNRVEFDFTAGDGPLNRSDDLLYSLFVPARASHALPVFDQPDLKARWSLTLDLPATWQAVANGAETTRTVHGERARVQFAETEPLPTYLFAFAAGRFEVAQYRIGSRVMRMFHRERDAARLARNGEAIARAHAQALDWLEAYTGMPYPYGKFDYVALPAFQFGGMEHPGAIWYNAERLLLDATATQTQLLRRANVIAHETAHMWFGDLVTMRWFDDVWLKEVFANFMAAKIVNPQFPDVDHDLRFFLQHVPGAYDIDRTAGANPIRQPLDNLADAGSLYGSIIYLKAPVVMRQLELLLGEDNLRDGLREYLRRWSHGNATWPDLIALLDARTPADLAAWSRAWVDARGRPRIDAALADDATRIVLTVSDPAGRPLVWPQTIQLAAGYADGIVRHTVALSEHASVMLDPARGKPLWLLPAAGGLAYGDIVLPPAQASALAQALPTLTTPLDRGAAMVTLWESMLEGRVAPADMRRTLMAALPAEADELNIARDLAYLRALHWRHSTPAERARNAPAIEHLLRKGIDSAPQTRVKAAWFAALTDVALTPPTLDWLAQVWRRQIAIPALPLAEADETDLALALMLRGGERANGLLDAQIARMDNADRKARLAFLRPALSASATERARFQATLKVPANRARESWVLDAMGFVHHPLHDETALDDAIDALTLLPELQRTGDIFLPKNWADAVLAGYASPEAAKRVRAFIDTLPAGYPPRLRWVLLASADTLLRQVRQ